MGLGPNPNRVCERYDPTDQRGDQPERVRTAVHLRVGVEGGVRVRVRVGASLGVRGRACGAP